MNTNVTEMTGSQKKEIIWQDEEIKRFLHFVLAIILAFIFTCIPLSIDPIIQKAVAVTIFMVINFILEPIPLAMTGLIGGFLYTLLGVAKFEVSFSGFTSATTWYILGALLIGGMVTACGLAKRIAVCIMKLVGTSFARILAGTLLLNFILTFIVPSGIARVTILATIAVGIAQAIGYGKESNIGRCLVLGVTFSAALFDKGILGGGAAVLARGLIEQYTGVGLLYSQWLFMFIPFDIIIIFLTWWLLLRLFPPEAKTLKKGKEFIEQQASEIGPLSAREIKALIITIATVVIWMTDFIHHISPSLIGIAAGLIAVMPGIGILKEEEIKKTNFLMVIFVGMALGMGEVLVRTGAADVMANALFNWVKPVLLAGGPIANGLLYIYNFVLHILLADELSMLASTMPTVLNFAIANGLDAVVYGLIWTYATGAKIFIYESAPLVAGYAFGYFSTKDMLKFAGVVSVVQLIIILFLPYWWHFFL